ncbi:stage III sporulation protein AB [Clostridium cavendishii DSM 21758]|uniref:Stage III sporulation protein AB n=1 Tax=Clostridium cavendishii DSM 21758 TaxID=1121302 RepID=A0A1M6KLF9_9CLOT|nr:stage III sporulation protein SpoIIIAB [Clostridium cavendishii]SHJ59711.1 stage III sporulation protein AB [Clostridium cavendishii DSM 21758]
MLRLLFLIFIVVICSILGYIYGEKFNSRFLELQELLRIIINLQNEILFCYTPLPECFKKIHETSKKPVGNIFKMAGEKLNDNEVYTVYEAIDKSIKENKQNMSLKNEDYNILLDLSKSLGETSIDGQTNIFELAKDNLKRVIEIADSECQKNRKLYRYLGVSLGFMIAIFLF